MDSAMGGFPGFPWVPRAPRRKFHRLRAFGALGTKRYAKIQEKTLDEIYVGERERKKAKKAKKVKVLVPVVFSDYYI